MLFVAVFALLAASAIAKTQSEYYSFSSPAGSGNGQPFALNGEGRITAVRVWEYQNRWAGYIKGFQFRYGPIWSSVAGSKFGTVQEIELFEGEAIVQISGKTAYYVNSVVFTTSKGRSLYAGRPSGSSFNMYPANSQAELCFISGNVRGFITAIGAHWAVVPAYNSATGEP